MITSSQLEVSRGLHVAKNGLFFAELMSDCEETNS